MQKKYLLIFILILISLRSFEQASSDSLLKLADTFFKGKQFLKAAPLCVRAAELADNKLSKNAYYYYAALAFANIQDSSNCFKYLDLAIRKYGFNDIPALTTDEVFSFISAGSRWKKLIAIIKPTYTTSPLKVKIIDTDVRNFWAAYDMVKNDTSNAVKIYREQYIGEGTMALQDYFLNKIGTVENFVYIHNLYAKFYKSIRNNSLKAAQFKDKYINSFINLKKIYPEAIFPNVFFVMGKFNSAGTTSSNGLIIGIDMRCYSEVVDTTELGDWEKKNMTRLSGLPYTVAHEMVHFIQSAMASDTTLLKASIIEGMADFIGELISGKNSNERLHIYAKGKEKQIWNDFKKEMYLNRAGNWIANSEQETIDKPADLGYWVGYRICKEYYDNSKNKKQAIYDMLHIRDYKKFFEESKMEDQINNTR